MSRVSRTKVRSSFDGLPLTDETIVARCAEMLPATPAKASKLDGVITVKLFGLTVIFSPVSPFPKNLLRCKIFSGTLLRQNRQAFFCDFTCLSL